MSAGLQSNLLLTLPLVVFVAGGLWLWCLLEEWLDPELSERSAGAGRSLNSDLTTADRLRRVERGAGERERASVERLARTPRQLMEGRDL